MFGRSTDVAYDGHLSIPDLKFNLQPNILPLPPPPSPPTQPQLSSYSILCIHLSGSHRQMLNELTCNVI